MVAERRALPEWPAASLPLRTRIFATLGAALAWFAHLFASYVVVAVACAAGWRGTVPAITVLTVLLTLVALASGGVALRHWRRLQGAESWEHALNEAGGHEGLLLLVGAMAAAIFALLIVLNGLSPFLLPECPS